MAMVTVSRAGDRLIAVKQVASGRARDLEREAETIKRLDHPGLVRFVGLIETPDGGRALHTEFVSSDTWSTRPLNDPAERAAGLAVLAGVVADLHDLGVAHGQLDATHVLHGDGDRPVLCGLRLAAPVTAENRRDDLVALADLCHRPALGEGPLVGKLSALADAVRAGRLDARELARRLDLLLDKRSGAPGPVRHARERTAGPRRERSKPRALVIVAAVLGASAAVLAAGVWSRSQGTSAPATITDPANTAAAAAGYQAGGPDPLGAAMSADAAAPSPFGTAAAKSAAHPTGAPQADAPQADADITSADPAGPAEASGSTAYLSPMVPGGAAPGSMARPSILADDAGTTAGPHASEPLLPPTLIPAQAQRPEDTASHQPGAVLEHGGNRYGVGTAGDFVTTGDWDCDGRPTPAIIRPSTGHVVLFDTWPAAGQSVAMPVRWEVDTPTGAEAVAQGPCDLLRVYTPAGSRLLDPMENH